jgi:hypothetical protein
MARASWLSNRRCSLDRGRQLLTQSGRWTLMASAPLWKGPVRPEKMAFSADLKGTPAYQMVVNRRNRLCRVYRTLFPRTAFAH